MYRKQLLYTYETYLYAKKEKNDEKLKETMTCQVFAQHTKKIYEERRPKKKHFCG